MPKLWPPLEEVAECTALTSRLAEVEAPPPINEAPGEGPQAALSPFVLDQIRKIDAARTLKAGDLKPGAIVLIDARRDLQGRILQHIAQPVGFCLERPGAPTTTTSGQVWAGWIAAPEVDYASCWDVVLEPGDEPFDPQAGMVQTWNPLTTWLPTDARVLAVLAPDRLAVVKEVALEAASAQTLEGTASPGLIHVRETLQRRTVLTGTPLNRDGNDSRVEYQALYRKLAQSLAAVAANEAVFAPVQAITRWIARHQQQTYALAASVLVAVVVVGVMRESKEDNAQPITVAQAPVQPPPKIEAPSQVPSNTPGATVEPPRKPEATQMARAPAEATTKKEPTKPAADRARPAQLIQLAYLDPALDVSGANGIQGGVVVRGNDSKGDSLRYFNLQLSDPAKLSAAIKLLEEMNILFKVADPAKGKLLVMEESTADFVAIDRKLGESGLFVKPPVKKPH